jgi:hypothetical protein
VTETGRDRLEFGHSLSPPSPILPFWHCSAETPERRLAPPRCSDVSFIVKHLPRAVDPETALHSKRMLQPREGGPTKSRNFVKPTMKPQRISI